jgi:HAD superfamily hydrolase (TIGR01549 family)
VILVLAIIFDVGMTLLHFQGDWEQVLSRSRQALAEFLLKEGYDIDQAEFISTFRELFATRLQERSLEHIEQPTANLFRQVMNEFGYREISEDEVKRAMIHFYSVSEAHWIPKAEVKKILERFRDEGYRMALISNAGDEANVLRLLDKGELRGYFDPILVSASEGIRKPHVDLFHKVLQIWGLSPKQVVMVGDSLLEDVLGAQKSGLHQIWLKEHVDTPENRRVAEKVLPEAVADSFTDIPQLIREMSVEDERLARHG